MLEPEHEQSKVKSFMKNLFVLSLFQNVLGFFLVIKSQLSSLNFRISISCLLPASWHFSISPVGCPRILNTTLRQIVVIGILAAAVSLLYYSLVVIRNKYGRAYRDKRLHR